MRRAVGAWVIVIALGVPALVRDMRAGGGAPRVPSSREQVPLAPAVVASPPAVIPPRPRAPARVVPATFHHNPLRFLSEAPPDSLDQLPGIGPVLAARIVDARRAGAFRSWADVDRVPGIGPKTIEKLKFLAERR